MNGEKWWIEKKSKKNKKREKCDSNLRPHPSMDNALPLGYLTTIVLLRIWFVFINSKTLVGIARSLGLH
jgi:hypothetical protein